jgi:predicted DCC family thiol-disulfide oxidoreductase YuxK
MTQTLHDSSRPTVIYDGDCAFCLQRIAEIKGWDKEQQLTFLPRQAQESEERFPQIAAIKLDDGILFIEDNGRVHVAADAMYQIYLHLPVWRRLAWLYQVPLIKQLCQVVYALIAANRKRLGRVCHNGSCKLPE